MSIWRPARDHYPKLMRELVLLAAYLRRPEVPTYTTATLPAAPVGPTLVFVSDAAAGSRFQGWDTVDSAWVPLG